MKKNLHITMLLILFLENGASSFGQKDAQLTLRPVVLGNTLLCPNSTATLHTQKIYDNYQWYKRDYFSTTKELIPGATGNELVVTNDDVLKYFSVEVRLKGVERTSDEKLIDGLVFIPPTVESSGDFINGPGFFVLKNGDTGLFTLLSPYNTNITWYKNNGPIANVTGNTLPVTTSGTYTVKGAPEACPDYIQNLGVNLIVKVIKNNKAPVITGDTMLCPDATGKLTTQQGFDSYQWYKRFYGSDTKIAIEGATTNTISINAYNDAPAYFSVVVTNNKNTLSSEEKLVDSYAFLPIAVISDGDFINGPGVFLLKKGDTGRFTITQPYDTNIEWYRNDAILPDAKSVALNVTKGGNYIVKAAPAVCPDYSQTLGVVLKVILVNTPAITSTSSTDELGREESSDVIRLYPNPAKDFVMVDAKEFKGGAVTINLYGQDGKIVLIKNFARASATMKLDLSNIRSGVYYIKVTDQLKQQVSKLVITK